MSKRLLAVALFAALPLSAVFAQAPPARARSR